MNKHKSTISTSMYPTGKLNKYKFATSTSNRVSLLYEFMKNYDILYCYMISINVYMHKTYVSH